MKTYPLSPAGIARLRQQYIQRVGWVILLVLVVMIGLNLWRGTGNSLITLVVAGVVAAGIALFSLQRGLAQALEIWQSIRIEVDDNYVGRSQVRLPPVRLQRSEITSVEEGAFGLLVHTADPARVLMVPKELDPAHYQAVKQQLSAWTTIQPQSAGTQVQAYLLMGGLLLAFGVLFFSTSIWLLLAAGVAVSGLAAYSFWSLRRAKALDPRYQRTMLLTIVVPLFIAAIKVCVLSGGYLAFMQWLTDLVRSAQ